MKIIKLNKKIFPPPPSHFKYELIFILKYKIDYGWNMYEYYFWSAKNKRNNPLGTYQYMYLICG